MNIMSANKEIVHRVSRWEDRFLKIQDMLDWFVGSSEKAVEVIPEDGEYQSVYNLANTIRQAIRATRRTRMLACRVWHGKVFLMKTF